MTLSVRDAAREAPDRVALVEGAVTVTFAELAERIRAVDLAGTERIALTPRPTIEALVPLYAAIDAGVAAVLLHPRLGDGERAAQLALAPPREYAPVMRSIAPTVPDDARPLAIVFSSGTLGTPKAVELSRAAFVASARASAANLGWRDGDAWLLCLSPAHVGGLSVLTRCLLARRPVVLLDAQDPAALAAALGRSTLASLVPAQLARLLASDPAWRAPAALRAVLLGGAAAPRALCDDALRRGVPLLRTYGLTESASQVATARVPGGPVLPLPGIPLRIADERIEIGGPTLMTRYLPEAAHPSPFTPDGWLRTNDRGRLDADGSLVVLGRADDVIVTGGENVDPLEVERVLESAPGVAAALVFGTPDATWGALVTAAVVPERDVALDPAALAAFVAGRLAPHKRPRRLAIVDAIPTTPGGKPDRAGALSRLDRAAFPLPGPA